MTCLAERNKVWATDIIGDDYKKWGNEIILLGIGTGRGKTRFALKTYCPYLMEQGKTVLYLCNRAKLKEQIFKQIDGHKITKNVTLISYQKLQELIRAGDAIPTFDAYICDEAHYFLADSEFNLYTDVSYDYLLRQTDATIIFMTATYHNIFKRIKKDVATEGGIIARQSPLQMYILPTDYGYVNKIHWFRSSDLYGIIDTILRDTDDKVLYFCNSLKKMQKFYNHYSPTFGMDGDVEKKYAKETNLQYMDFYCSDYSENTWANKHCNSDAIIGNIGDDYQFKNRVLVSTKCIDSGLSLKGRKLKHIICDVFDLESAIQCLGRKRILDKNDTCTFYIRDYQSYEINIFYRNTVRQLEPAQMFEYSPREWKEKYGKNREYKDYTIYFDFDITYDWKLNPLRYSKLQDSKELIKRMIDKKTSYRKEILDYLGESANGKSIGISEIKDEKTRDAIQIFIDLHVDQKLDKEKQKKLVELCDIRDRFGRMQKSIGIVNKYLEVNYGYKITPQKIERNIEGKRKTVTHWQINKKDTAME